MRIPKTLKIPRYYVARTISNGISYWETYVEALEAYKELLGSYPLVHHGGIVKVTKEGRNWLFQRVKSGK